MGKGGYRALAALEPYELEAYELEAVVHGIPELKVGRWVGGWVDRKRRSRRFERAIHLPTHPPTHLTPKKNR